MKSKDKNIKKATSESGKSGKAFTGLKNLHSAKEKLNKTIFDISPSGMLLEDTKGNILDVNSALQNIFGYSREEFLKMNVRQLVPEKNVGMVDSDISELLKGNKLDHEVINVKKDGSIVHLALRETKFMLPDETEGILVIANDVTKRKEAEFLLQENELRLRTLINATPDIITFKDGDGRYLETNEANLKLFDLEGFDYRGKTDSELAEYSPFYKEALLYCEKTDKLVWEKNTVSRVEEIIPNPDGSVKIFDVIKIPLFYPDGDKKGLIIVGRDVSDAKYSKEALEESEKKYRNLVEDISEVIFSLDAQGYFTYVSPSIKKLAGYSIEELIGRHYSEYIHPDDLIRVSKDFDRLFSGIQEPSEYKIIVKGGGYLHVRSSSKVKFENGKPVSSKGILIDITDSKKNNYELKKAKEEAESALKVKSEFLARMSHEIRTPLNGVIGMTGLMLQSPLTIEQKDYLETIKNSGESLLLIINDILDFSRIEAGKMYVVKKSVDINNCIENIFELFSSKFTEKNLRFSYFKDNSIPQYLICDSEKIKQIISNLLSNALKFTQQGSVELSVSKVNIENNKLTLMFAVEDTGIGIDEKSVKLLFQPFSQLDSSNTRRYGGTGLGLTICKHLVELMEGKIWVESVPGKGSKFSFKINVEIDDKELINEKNNHPKDSVNNAALANIMPLRILLVEDNLINQKVTLKILRKFGYTADIAVNGIEAIEAVKNQDYDIIFMDIQMPEMDGYEATKNILGMYPHENQPIIIAITAAVMQGDRENCFAAGMVDYLPKPVLPDDIFGVLKKWGEKKIKID